MRRQSKIYVTILVLLASLVLPIFRPVPKVYAVDVPIVEASFPDPNFRAFVEEQYDTDDSGVLEQDELNAVRVMQCKGKEIADLTGIEHFTSLEKLDCSSNQLTTLDVSGCSNLVRLYCFTNQLTDLNVAGCSNLTELDCSSNKLEALDVSACSSLAELTCSNNVLVSLDVSMCANLALLVCGNNKLTSIYVSNLDKLTDLLCDNNKLEAIDLSGCTGLEIFTANQNRLKSLDMSGFENLRVLSCSGNQLTSLIVAGRSRLEYLICDQNDLTSLNVTGCTPLKRFVCNNNRLQSLNVSSLDQLVEFDCSHNQLSTLDVSSHDKLQRFDCSHNQLQGLTVRGCAYLESLTCSDNQLASLDLSGCVSLRSLYCDQNLLGSLDVSFLDHPLQLDCSRNKLVSLKTSDNLFKLNCSHNQLTELNVSGFAIINFLFCDHNRLTSLDVSACGDLWQLATCPQAAGKIVAVRKNDHYEIDLGSLPGVDIANVKAVTLADGNPLPAGFSYDNVSGILTIGADQEQAELKYVYDTNADLAKIDNPPFDYPAEDPRIVSTPDMEVIFTWAKPGSLTMEIPAGLNEANDVVITSESIVYRQGESIGAAFRLIGAELEDFRGVRLNGKNLAPSYYTVEAGSIVVKLKQEFLKTLSVGEYIVEVLTREGSGVKTLEIKASSPASTETTGDATTEDETTGDEATGDEATPPSPPSTEIDASTAPATGEARLTQYWWLAMLLLAVGVLLLLPNSLFFRKRKSQ